MEVPFPLASSSDLISFLTFHISTCWSASLESAAAPILAYALRRCPRPASKLLRWSGENVQNVPRLGDRPPFLADFLRKISRKFPSTSWYTRCWCSGTRGGPHQKSAAEVRLGGAMLQLGLILPRPAVDYASAGAQRPFVLERLHRSTSAKRGKQSMNNNNNILNSRATSSGICIAPLTSLVPPSHFNFEVK